MHRHIHKHTKESEKYEHETISMLLNLLAKCNECFGKIIFVIANTADDDDADYEYDDQLYTACGINSIASMWMCPGRMSV